MKAILRRMDAPSLFGAEIKDLAIDAEMQTSNRLHFKVDALTDKPAKYELKQKEEIKILRSFVLFFFNQSSLNMNAGQNKREIKIAFFAAKHHRDRETCQATLPLTARLFPPLRSMTSRSLGSRSPTSTSAASKATRAAPSARRWRWQPSPLASLCAGRRPKKSCEWSPHFLLDAIFPFAQQRAHHASSVHRAATCLHS